MQIKYEFTMDLTEQGMAPRLHMMQNDANTRVLQISLTAGDVAWNVPDGVTAAVAYRKPDGTRGFYDTLPDGTSAVSINGSVVTAILAPQALTAAGEISAALILNDKDLNQLATFPFVILAAPNPAAGAVSDHYYKYSTMEEISEAVETALKALSDATQTAQEEAASAIRYTEQTLTESEKAQARANIGAMAHMTGKGAPTTSTEGAVGCLYMDTDTGNMYKCTAAVDGSYTWVKEYDGYIGDYFDIEFVDGYYVVSNGSVYESSSYSYAKLNPKNAKSIAFTVFNQSSSPAVAFISGAKGIGGALLPKELGKLAVYEIPENCTEVRISCLTQYKDRFSVKTRAEDVIGNIESVYEQNKADITPTEWIVGYLSSSGILYENDSYCVTDYIPIFPYQKVTALCGTASSGPHWVFYDHNKNVVGYYKNTDANIRGRMVTVDTNGASYVRFSSEVGYRDSFTAYCSEQQPLPTIPERLARELPFLKPNDRPLPVEDMPENGGYMAIFDRIGVVGDSLSSGAMVCGTSTGTPTGEDMYHYSWIQFIARMCGSTGFNFSHGGMSTTSFLANSGGKLEMMQSSENKCKCYFIALGHNDRNASLAVGSADDIDLTDYNNNASTFYGNYAKIIHKIKEVEPNAIIFPITMRHSMFENEGWNSAVRHMAEIFDNVYVLDVWEHYRERPDWHDTEGHGNIMGYLWYSKVIACYVDWIVRNNPEKFKYVQFIGTEYAQYIPENVTT